MSAGRMAAQRLRRSHRGDTGAEASAGDNAGHADARPTVTVHVPLSFRQRRGRKVLVASDGTKTPPSTSAESRQSTSANVTAAVRAFARAFRWRRLLETGAVATIHEIAATENINPSYVSRVLRLTLLAPDVVEARIETGGAATLDRLMLPFPTDWFAQASLEE